MKYKAVLYDMDGTVLDTLADLTDAVNVSLRRFGLPEQPAVHVRDVLGNGARRLIMGCLPEGTDERTADAVLEFYKPYYDAHCREKTAPYPGITELMQRLRDAGVKQAVVSNKPDGAVKELAELFFGGLIESAVGESETVRLKPCPDAVLAAAKLMGVSKDECVYVGDSEVDIETARRAGMDCISVAWGFRDEDMLRAEGAACIVRSAEELFEALK